MKVIEIPDGTYKLYLNDGRPAINDEGEHISFKFKDAFVLEDVE